MNRYLLSLVLVLSAFFLHAQAPAGFKFQAVARDVDNNAMATDNIAVRVSLLKGGPSGSVSYSEYHEVTTTDLGVFDLHIGNGVGLSGDMSTIDWGADNYYLKVDIDPDGGNSYVNLGASQLLSVPYAMYANSAGSGGGGGNPTDELQNLLYDPSTQTLTLTDGNSVTLQVGGGGGGMPQSLSFDEATRTLTISDGNAIVIPGGTEGPQGPEGEQGPAGPEGPIGPAGPEGPQGPAGTDGTGINLLGTVATVANLPASGNTNGDLYIVTADGSGYAWDGSMWNSVGPVQGPKGDQGDAGPAGPKGDQGDPGAAGPAGPQGDAGPAGPKGDQGDTGPAGPAGPAGQDGTGISLLGTVTTVANLPASGNSEGDLYIVSASGDGYAWDGSMWTNVGPIQGPEGPQGDAGAAGPTGPKGDQGDAGAAGPQGDAGPAGPKGDQGDTGPAGPAGPAGQDGTGISLLGTVTTVANLPASGNSEGDLYIVSASGDGYAWDGSMWTNVGPIQGPEGPQGDAGAAGPAGPKGDQGDAGAAGPQGYTGPQGPIGPKGDKGDPGNVGPAGPAGELELPYYDEAAEENGAAFHVQNDATNGRYGIAGSAGTGAESLPSNNAGVLGHGVGAHGVYGVAANSFWAGVQGVSNSATGVGVQGYGFGGGVGGHFYTTSTGVAALTTGRGNVGFGTQEPEEDVHVAGDLFVQSNLGNMELGFPGDGNRWRFSTIGSGANLQFRSKPDGSNTYTTRFKLNQDGEFQLGTTGSPSAWAHVRHNSTLNKPHMKLEEVGNDYARLELTNSTAGGAFWHVAGLPSATTASARLNFYFRNANGAADRMTITGDGEVGINGTPTARLHVHQRSQTVGTGLRFSDNTANQDWDVTHGFALRFHYGGNLRGFINANTGAYTQSSDARLKTAIASITPVMDKLRSLSIKTYQYKSAEKPETTIGLLAQEAKELFPELVSYSTVDELYGVNYAGFSMVAIKAIQEQQAMIDGQQTEIDDLKARLVRLETLLGMGKQ